MEIELKYKIQDKNFDLWQVIIEKYSLHEMQEVQMDALYFDTLEDSFLKKGIALRIRIEDDKRIATVKTKGTSQQGLHSREEWNKDVSQERDILFDQWFEMDPIGKELCNILKDQTLKEKIRTLFTRKKAILNYKDSQLEIAVDKGEIRANNLKEQIYELEIELIKGKKESLIEFGNQLACQYNIMPENVSKYARGLNLLNHIE